MKIAEFDPKQVEEAAGKIVGHIMETLEASIPPGETVSVALFAAAIGTAIGALIMVLPNADAKPLARNMIVGAIDGILDGSMLN